MADKTLFLAWQDRTQTKEWFPIGRLDVSNESKLYTFRYVRGAEKAHTKSLFEPLYDFPDFHSRYESANLFPLFKNRVLSYTREDFPDYLNHLNLTSVMPDPIEILSIDGGYRATDSFEVFPKIKRADNGAFQCRFFLHGWSHVNDTARERISQLKQGEQLYVTLELTNPATQTAIQIQTTDYHMIGWAPRYLVHDLVKAIAEAPGDYRAKVVQVNPMPVPSKQRLLIELTGSWPEYEPMSSGDFELLAK